MNKREFIKSTIALSAASMLPLTHASNKGAPLILKSTIPSSGQLIPIIGMGTNRNLSVEVTTNNIASKVNLLKTFFDLGGEMLDSSPMYETSEQVIGQCLKALDYPETLFSATKVWTRGASEGILQMQNSRELWGLDSFDLMQIHNLVDWKLHLNTLRQWKEHGLIKYIGITTSHGRNHQELAEIMRKEPLDFVQFTYNIKNREAENVLLPLAAEKGIAVIINRPFKGLFGYTKGMQLPTLAKEMGCNSWAQFYLKFAISHPAVTCAIPATSKLKHLKENMLAGTGMLPDQNTRQEMSELFSQYI